MNKSEEISYDYLQSLGRDFYSKLYQKWLFLFATLIIAISILIYQKVVYVPKYEAALTFMINEDTGGASSLGSILGQFGYNTSSNFNPRKVRFLLSSEKIQKEAFFDSVSYGKENYLINEILENYDLPNKWSKDEPELADFKFTDSSLSSLSEKAVFKRVLKFVNRKKNPLIRSFLDDDTGAYRIIAKTSNEELSIQLSKSMYKALSSFYITQAVDRQKKTNSILKNKVDSIQNELNKTNYSIANFRDKSQSVWSSKNGARLQTLEQERSKLSAMYAEAIKNYEYANYTLNSQTPFFQLVDEPFVPLNPEKFSLVKGAILAAGIAITIYLFYILFLIIFQEIKS